MFNTSYLMQVFLWPLTPLAYIDKQMILISFSFDLFERVQGICGGIRRREWYTLVGKFAAVAVSNLPCSVDTSAGRFGVEKRRVIII